VFVIRHLFLGYRGLSRSASVSIIIIIIIIIMEKTSMMMMMMMMSPRGVTKHRTGHTVRTGPKYWSFLYEKG